MTRPAPALGPALLVYTAGRLGLIALVAAVLTVAGVPLLLAVLIAVIVALPLAAVVLRGPRARLDEALAVTGARRSAAREALRSSLRGDEDHDEPREDHDEPRDGHDEAGGADVSDGARQPQADGREHGPGQ